MAAKKTTRRSTTAKKRQTRRSPRVAKLALPSQARIGAAEALKKDLQKLLTGGKPIEIDASQVEKVDTSVMQLLAAFCTDADSRSINVQWHNTGETIPRAAELLGLTDHLKLPAQSRPEPADGEA